MSHARGVETVGSQLNVLKAKARIEEVRAKEMQNNPEAKAAAKKKQLSAHVALSIHQHRPSPFWQAIQIFKTTYRELPYSKDIKSIRRTVKNALIYLARARKNKDQNAEIFCTKLENYLEKLKKLDFTLEKDCQHPKKFMDKIERNLERLKNPHMYPELSVLFLMKFFDHLEHTDQSILTLSSRSSKILSRFK